MSTRTTMRDVTAMFERVQRSARAVLPAEYAPRIERWSVERGSATYGRAWRLYQLGADTLDTERTAGDPYPYGSGHYSAAGLPDYLGMTAVEAYRALHMIAATFEAIEWARAVEAERSKNDR